MSSQEALAGLFGQSGIGTLVTLKRDGRPQISNITYVFDGSVRTFTVSLTDGRAKTANIRRDPRVSLEVDASNGWSYAVAEGTGELSPVAQSPADATVDGLVAYYRTVSGEHPDWAEYRAAMVADRRLLLRIDVERFYGLVR